MFNLKGKTALITGSGQGIGRSIALLLARKGARVIINWRSNDEIAGKTLAALENEGLDYMIWKYDLSETTVREDFLNFMEINGITVDILVLNASVQIRNEWEGITEEEFDIQMHTNLYSSLALIQACVPKMRKKGWGRIVTIGSVQQYRPNTAMAIYAASKAGIRNLVMTLSIQLAKDGININNVAPGCIETIRNTAVLSNPEYRKRIEESIPAGYIGHPDDIAATVLLLCSEEGRYITGADIPVDGGMSIPST